MRSPEPFGALVNSLESCHPTEDWFVSSAAPAPADRPREKWSSSPWPVLVERWKDVLAKAWWQSSADNIGLAAAGVAFYGFLALVPLLGSLVLTYGFIADPQAVVQHIRGLTSFIPTDAAKLIGDQLLNVIHSSSGKKGFGLVVALAVALFGAANAAGGAIVALNIAYEQKETRSYFRVTLLALAITGVTIVATIVAMLAAAALAYLQQLLPWSSPWLVVLGKVSAYLALMLAGAAAAATLYRFAPAKGQKWVWLTPGSVLFGLLWVVLTLGFGFYVARFGNYNATYGALSAVIVLLTWAYLSNYALLFGAELNCEIERQSGRDPARAGPHGAAAEGG
ncbi:MAG: YihY/virulence factor BrkB family protein [Novosphingobium sp.]|nr:YihY/virulence factor BrkB family protein [Novosphingobium sp.]